MSDIPEAAIEAGAAALRRSWDDATEYGSAEEMAACALAAAMPHLRETLAENSVLLTNRVLTLEARVKTLETKGGDQ